MKTAKILKRALLIFVILTSIIGTLGIYNFVAGDVYQNPDLIFTIGGSYSFVNDFRSRFESADYFKPITTEITTGCYSDECKAKKIFENVTGFEYVLGTDLNPIHTWANQYGDCDEISYLYVIMLKAEGINSRMQCSQDHCWDIVMIGKKRFIADAVNNIWREV